MPIGGKITVTVNPLFQKSSSMPKQFKMLHRTHFKSTYLIGIIFIETETISWYIEHFMKARVYCICLALGRPLLFF
jgi:hypothetical protein